MVPHSQPDRTSARRVVFLCATMVAIVSGLVWIASLFVAYQYDWRGYPLVTSDTEQTLIVLYSGVYKHNWIRGELNWRQIKEAAEMDDADPHYSDWAFVLCSNIEHAETNWGFVLPRTIAQHTPVPGDTTSTRGIHVQIQPTVDRLIQIPMWLPLTLAGVIAVFSRARPHKPPGSCHQCGYDLSGNVSGVCPECGNPIPSSPRCDPPS